MAEKGGDYPTNHPLSGLIQTAALTNRELFTAVIAAIKREGSAKQQKQNKYYDKKKDVSWQRVAMKVATSAAKGEDGYAFTNDWVARFNEFLVIDSDGGSKNENGSRGHGADDDDVDDAATKMIPTNFGEAIRVLSIRDCHRKRLRNALDALSSSIATPSSTKSNLSMHQVAGLIRGSSFLSNNEVGDADDSADSSSSDEDDIALQTRVISHLVQSISTLASSPSSSADPCDIFLAVQLPLLQKLHRDAFINGGFTFTPDNARAEFHHLLHLKFDKESRSSGEKRRRMSEVEDCDAKKNDVLPYSASTAVHRLFLEAAHLARNGAVRAQHGAIIYMPTSSEQRCDGDGEVQIIGRGWNHDYLLDPSTSNKNKIVLHSEVHAVADAISRYGEDECFESLFPRATIVIVELHSDYAYETCHPCPKCDPMLRAVGIGHVLHSTPHGKLAVLDYTHQLLNSNNSASLLSNENVYIPLSAACRELEICCKRLPTSRV
ncbi:hypothetical protein ACHAXH_003569 [Discostella pseudostelligera]